MDYHDVSHFAQTWGLVFLVVLFAGALAYAFWPKNQQKFDAARQVPLQDDTPDDSSDDNASSETTQTNHQHQM